MKKTFLILLILSVNIFSQSWVVQSNPAIGSVIRIQAFDTNLVYALTSTQVLKTTNGGNNWNVILPAPSGRTFTGWQWDAPNIGSVRYYNPNEYLHTTNGGNNWQAYPVPEGSIIDMQSFNGLNRIYYINDAERFWYTTNSGNNWYSSSISGYTINSLGRMYFVNEQTGFFNGGTSWTYYHALLRTTNAGFTWTVAMSSTNDGYEGGGDFKFFGSEGFHVSNNTYRTTNFGANWTQLNGQGGGKHALFLHDPQWGWLGKQSGLLKTTNGCTTWVDQNIGVSGIDIFSISFINYNTGWISGENTHILKTTNGSGVTPPAQAPTLIAPPNNSTGQSLTPLLQWNPVTGAVRYRVQVSVDVFNTTVLDYDTVSVTQLQVPSGLLTNNVQYYWRVTALNIGGQGPWSVVWNFRTGMVGINPVSNEIPSEYKLYSNYPNPFNPTTSIRFDLPKQSFAKMVVYDLLGREVASLVNEQLNAGTYEVDFDGSNLASGVYYYTLIAGDFKETRKMVLIK